MADAAGDRTPPVTGPARSARVRDQSSLTRSSGRIWLVVGGLLALVALGALVADGTRRLPPEGVPVAAAVAVASLYVAMVVVRWTVHRRRARLAVLAILLLAIAGVALAAVLVVAFASAAP